MRRIAPALLALLAGCAATKGAEPTMTLRLAPAPPAARAVMPGSAAIVVAPVQARGLAGATRYTYVDAASPAELRQAKTIFWEESPALVVDRALIDALRARIATVSTAGQANDPAARRLFVTLERFEEDSAGGAAAAAVTLAAIIPASGAARYCASAPIGGASGTARARAFEAAIAASVAALAQDAAAGRLAGSGC